MAEDDFLKDFDDIQIDTEPLGDLHDLKNNSAATENGLSDFQRGVVKNFFDTQPKKRASYLRRLGYEMNPKNPEEYRPTGSDTGYDQIEPDNTILGFIPYYNLFSQEGRDELKRDFGDIAFDLGVEGPITGAAITAGATKGAAIGLVSPVPGGSVLGAGVGAGIAGAGSKALVEGVKAGIGEFFLDEDVPMDMQETMYQSLVTGGFGVASKSLGRLIKNYKAGGAKDIQKALKEAAIRKSNGTFNQKLVDDLAENPSNYTPEKVEGATDRLLDLQDEIFGTSVDNPHSTKQLTKGIAREAIDPLNKQADLEIDKLSQMPEANFSFDEVAGLIRDRKKVTANKKFRTQDEERALKFLNAELKRLRNKTMTGGKETSILGPDGNPLVQPVEFSEITFKEGRDFLKSLQNKAFQDGPLKGNATLSGVARGMKEVADIKAGDLGSNLPAINGKRSDILGLYKDMNKMIKDGTIQNSFVGKDTVGKERVIRLFDRVDAQLDTDIAKKIKSGQFEVAVENLYNRPAAFGSGSVIKDVLKAGIDRAPKEAFKFGTLGAASPLPGGAVLGAKIGAVKGFLQGAREGASLSSPDTLIKSFTKIKSRIDNLDRALAAPATAKEAAIQSAKGGLSKVAQVAPQVDVPLAQAGIDFVDAARPQPAPVPQAAAPAPEEDDFLSQFDDLKIDLTPLGNQGISQ